MKYTINPLRIFILALAMNFAPISFGQDDAAVILERDVPEMRVDGNFAWKYNHYLRLLRRTYPMALKAKELIDAYEADLADIEKKRQQKKYGRDAHAELKEEFLFNIRDLYVSEGELLMKLIHRETGMTVNDIVERYRGGFQQTMYSGIAKLWGNDLDATFDAEGEDWVTELIIYDIQTGQIDFDLEMRKMTKDEFKESKDAYREKKRDMRRDLRDRKKEMKAEERKKKKDEKKAETN
ncbi:MAG: DUF4294 domain-containing protein [Crocinitomicaceae bacterium]|nr:DUF4294 domain-containing protein [Crocinitomicaceae bacterium]